MSNKLTRKRNANPLPKERQLHPLFLSDDNNAPMNLDANKDRKCLPRIELIIKLLKNYAKMQERFEESDIFHSCFVLNLSQSVELYCSHDEYTGRLKVAITNLSWKQSPDN